MLYRGKMTHQSRKQHHGRNRNIKERNVSKIENAIHQGRKLMQHQGRKCHSGRKCNINVYRSLSAKKIKEEKIQG